MRRQQAHETDDAAHRYRGRGETGGRRQEDQLDPLDVHAQLGRLLIPQQQDVQFPRVDEDDGQAHRCVGQQHPDVVPSPGGQAAHEPEEQLALVLPAHHEHVGREGSRHGADGNAGQKQGDRSHAASPARKGVYHHGHGQAAEERRDGYGVQPEHPEFQVQGDRDRGTQRGAGRYAHDIGIGHWVLEETLHHPAGTGQGGPYKHRQEGSGQADLPDNGVGRRLRRLERAARPQVIRQHLQHGASRDIHGAHPHGEDTGGEEDYGRQDQYEGSFHRQAGQSPGFSMICGEPEYGLFITVTSVSKTALM